MTSGETSAEKRRARDATRSIPREGAGKKVLVIDDEEPILQMVREALTRRGYHVDIGAPTARAGLRQLSGRTIMT